MPLKVRKKYRIQSYLKLKEEAINNQNTSILSHQSDSEHVFIQRSIGSVCLKITNKSQFGINALFHPNRGATFWCLFITQGTVCLRYLSTLSRGLT